MTEHNKTFLGWFKKKVYGAVNASDTLLRLARGPSNDVITYGGYDINSCCFYSEIEDAKSRVQNSGVTIQAESVHFASSKDKNLITASMSYFGVIQEYGKLIMLHSECLCSSVNGLMATLVCGQMT